jgi:hypothetical protein
MEIVNHIKYDIAKRGVPPVIDAVQGEFDSRIIELSIFANGYAFSVDGCVCSLAFSKPDGMSGWYDTMPDGSTAYDVSGNVVSVKIAPQVLSVDGDVRAAIRIETQDNEKRVTTFPFVISVSSDPANNAPESENYYSVQNWDEVNAAINELKSMFSDFGAVRYTPQTLTEEEKAQARENIGAAGAITVNIDRDTRKANYTSKEIYDFINAGYRVFICDAGALIPLSLSLSEYARFTHLFETGDVFIYTIDADGNYTTEVSKYALSGQVETVREGVNQLSDNIAAQLENSKGVTVTNMLENGNFANGTAPWVAYFGTMAVTDNGLTFTNNGSQRSAYVMQAVTTEADHKYYAKARVRVTNADCEMIVLRDSVGALKQITAPVQNEWYDISEIKTGLSTQVNVRHYYADAATANGKVMEIANVMVVDLTDTYGSGNEPDIASFEAVLAKFSDGWFDGTVSIEYMSHIRPCINVKMYGAVGDGEADDTEALQKAFDDGAGGTVYIPTGVYKITKSLYISSNTIIEGDGEGSQIILGDGYTLDQKPWRNDNCTPKYVVVVLATRENASNITLRNIRLTGNKTQFVEERCLGIALIDCSNCLVENCISEYNNFKQKTQEEHVQSLGQCIAILRSSNVTIRGGRYEYSGYECIGLEFATDCLVDGVYSGYGWRCSLQLHRGCKNIKIVNNVIWNDSPVYASAALTMHGGESVVDAPVDGVVISNNTIYANVDSDPTRNACGAIACIDDGEKNIVIANNHITTNRSGIFTSATDENIVIKGNTIHTTKQGARLLAKNLLFTDNIVINTCETNSQETIAIGGDSDTVIVANNVIEAENAKGINFFVGAVGGAEIRNNIIKTYAAGIYSSNRSLSKFIASGNHVTNQDDSAIYYIQPASNAKDTYVEIKDNVISNTGASASGIYVNGNVQRPIITGNSIRLATTGIKVAGGVDYALIALNDLVGATTKISAQSGENNLIVNNLGVV